MFKNKLKREEFDSLLKKRGSFSLLTLKKSTYCTFSAGGGPSVFLMLQPRLMVFLYIWKNEVVALNRSLKFSK